MFLAIPCVYISTEIILYRPMREHKRRRPHVFTQLTHTSKTRQDSNGRNLTTAKKIVKEHSITLLPED